MQVSVLGNIFRFRQYQFRKAFFWEYMGNFFNIRARKFRSWKYKKIFGLENSISVVFFLSFLGFGMKRAGFRFWKYKKAFLLKKPKKSFLLREYKEFFDIWARKFYFSKYKKFFWGWIFYFWALGFICPWLRHIPLLFLAKIKTFSL